jgi:hypothetical protein
VSSKKKLFTAVIWFFILGTSLACMTVQRLVFGPPTATPIPPTPVSISTPTATAESACYTDECISACLQKLVDIGNERYNLSTDAAPTSSLYNEGDGYLLTIYRVEGDDIVEPFKKSVPSELYVYQNDTVTQRNIWRMFTAYIPSEYREEISYYVIFTDGPSERLAAVGLSDNDPQKWVLDVDIVDAKEAKDLTYTLIHEFGHLLTLNATQITPDMDVFDHPDDKGVYLRAANACPNYFTDEGCSESESYINLFFQHFWPGIYDEWKKIDGIKNEEQHYARLDQFYDTYQDQFVTDYAVTSPEEDIAESFTHFIFSPEPSGNSIAEQKIKFFYGFPEIVTLRTRLDQRICGNLNP